MKDLPWQTSPNIKSYVVERSSLASSALGSSLRLLGNSARFAAVGDVVFRRSTGVTGSTFRRGLLVDAEVSVVSAEGTRPRPAATDARRGARADVQDDRDPHRRAAPSRREARGRPQRIRRLRPAHPPPRPEEQLLVPAREMPRLPHGHGLGHEPRRVAPPRRRRLRQETHGDEPLQRSRSLHGRAA